MPMGLRLSRVFICANECIKKECTVKENAISRWQWATISCIETPERQGFLAEPLATISI